MSLWSEQMAGTPMSPKSQSPGKRRTFWPNNFGRLPRIGEVQQAMASLKS